MLLDDTHAVMTEQEFSDLLDYSCSLPTGQTIGKMWKRDDNAYRPPLGQWPPYWWLGEYTGYSPDGGKVLIKWREILVISKLDERPVQLRLFG